MKLVNLDAAINKQPFRPFEIRVDGEVIVVRHPEQIVFAEKKTTLIVVDPQDHFHILDVDQISKIRLLPRRGSNGTSTKSRQSE
ncbi:MAG: hypothetical protein ABI042_00525 [Verrucomicrobiota bacterium]